MKLRTIANPFLVLSALVVGTSAASALTLTPQGISDGFTLDLFMSGIPSTSGTPSSGCCGPLGIATNSVGRVVMQVYTVGNFQVSDVNGQTFNPATQTSSLTSSSYGMAITNSGGTLYAGNDQAGGLLQKLNSDGSFNSNVLTIPGGVVAGHGIATNPINGNIITSASNGIWSINPITGVATHVVTAFFNIDGVSVSADGQTVYAALDGSGNVIAGWRISDGTPVFTSDAIGAGPDGTGVIGGSGLFAGDIVANDNNGGVWLIDKSTGHLTQIAFGGTRGDYVGVDGNDGSLFLTQTNEVYKLGCGRDCGFVGTPSVPEPSTWAMMIIGFAGLGYMGFRQRKRMMAA
jgi:hypothetical protein